MPKSALNKSAEYEQYYQDLGNNNETKIFDTMKDVFMFAAALGFRNHRHIPIQKSGGEPISLRFFKDEDFNIFNVIALSHTNDISILLDDDEYKDKKYRIIEEYANGGMSILIEEICKPVVDVNAFKKFVETFYSETDQPKKSNLEDILSKAMDSI